jgi:hypothetical protein
MNLNKKIIKKYESKNPKCIGPCYNPNTIILHPTEHFYMSSIKYFCPTEPVTIKTESGDTITKYVKECDIKSNNNFNIIPQFIFSYSSFLQNYYKISSYDDFIKFLTENKNKNIITNIRIIECGLNVFKPNFIDDLIIQKYIDFINKYKIEDIYLQLYKLIDYSKKIKIRKNNLDKNKYEKQRKEYILENYINQINISKLLIKLIKSKKTFTTDNIIKEFIQLIKKDLS